MTLQEAKEQAQKYIAQWVIDNRYQKNENKIGDHEMFHTIIDTTSSLLESCAKEARNNAIDECINMIGKLTDDEIITELLSLKDELLNLKENKCQCSFAMVRRDKETQKAYCFECKK